MSRTTKDPEERRNEILDTAQRLFIEKGFIQTSVSEIVKEIGVAQGTFYYYFKTKEDILDAIIDRYINEITVEAESCLNNPDWDIKQKMENIIISEIKIVSKNNSYLHRIQSADIHTRMLTVMVKKLTPVYARIIEEGIQSGIWKTDYPQEFAESMLVSSHILFDPGLFHRTKEEFERCILAWRDSMEKTLGMEKGWMDSLKNIFFQIYKRL